MSMIQGKARYAKIVGRPVDGFNPGEKNKEWTFDLVIGPEAEEKLKEEGVTSKIRETEDGERYTKFKRRAYKTDGTEAKPIKIVDKFGKDWEDGVKIGNGSVLNVKYNVRPWEFGKKKGVSADVIAVQVWEHVPYEGGDDFPKADPEEWKEDDD